MDTSEADSSGSGGSPPATARAGPADAQRAPSLFNLRGQPWANFHVTVDSSSGSESPAPDALQLVPVQVPDNEPGPSHVRYAHNGSTFQLRGRPNRVHHVPEFSHSQRFNANLGRNGYVNPFQQWQNWRQSNHRRFEDERSGRSSPRGMMRYHRRGAHAGTVRERIQEYERRLEANHERQHWLERRRRRGRVHNANSDRSRSPSRNEEN